MFLAQSFAQIPANVKLFIKRALLCIVAWVLCYYIVLQRLRLPDRWITNITAAATQGLLNKFYAPGFTLLESERITAEGHTINGTAIEFNKLEALYVADACNALELYVLYIAFLFCLPTTIKRIMIFSVAGIAAIFVLNITRCYALAILSLHKSPWLNIAHHFIFTLIVYSCIFAGWVLYAKKYDAKKTI